MATQKFKAEYTTFAYDESTKAFVPQKGSMTLFGPGGFEGTLESVLKEHPTGLVSVTLTALAPDHSNGK
jgi:hypothetical protein